MSPRERVLRALAGEETDIVPYDMRMSEAIRDGLLRCSEGLELTGRIVNHLPFYPIEARQEWTHPDRYVDAFGCVWRAGRAPHLEEPPLREPSLRGYAFPDLCEDPYFAGVDGFLAAHQDRFVLCGDAHGLFDRAWALRGMEPFLVDMVAQPAFVEELLDALTELHLGLVDRIARYPFDGFRFGDDWGAQRGLIMGPARWRRLLKPRLARIFGRARERGLVVMVHSCGDVSSIIPDLIDIGVQILNPVQPEAMDVLEVKRRYGRHLCLNGGISTQLTLPRGSVEEVQREVEACLRYLGRGGGYVFSPSKPILPDVPLANAVALLEAVVEQRAAGPATTRSLPGCVPDLQRVYAAFHP
jgi:uroporphyrinogen decarboxylase